MFNEGVRNAGAVLMQIERPAANTMMRSAGGGLGWSGGVCAGRKARGAGADDRAGGRRRRLLFRQSELGVRGLAAIRAADPDRRDGQPGWSAVKSSTLRVFPKGEAVRPTNSSRICSRTPISARSRKRSAPTASGSKIRMKCRQRSRVARRRCVTVARPSCMPV